MFFQIFLLLFSAPVNNGALLLNAGDSQSNNGADVLVVRDFKEVTVKKSGASTEIRNTLYKVLTLKGASKLTTFKFDVDPSTNDIKVLKIYKYSKSGKRSELPVRIYEAPQPAGWILWRFRMRILTIGALQVGEGLQIITKKKGFLIAYLRGEKEFIPPMRGHFYDQHLFGDSPFPVKSSIYKLKVPLSMKIQSAVYNGAANSIVKFNNKYNIYTWWKDNLPAFKHEPRMPYSSNSLTKIIATTVADWGAKSRWFYNANKDQFKVTKAIKNKVKKIIKGAKSRDEKIKRLTLWVANNIRYRGFSSYGKKEGYTLHSGEMVFRQRAGVCKDIASMLVTMLRGAGFTAYPAMTMAGARVENIPADQFNHSVVALKEKDGSYRMLDPTWAPMSKFTWSWAERKQHYVVGSPKGEELSIIPASKPEENLLSIKVNTKISKKGASSKVFVTGKGYIETSLRRLIGGTSVSEVKYLGSENFRALSPLAKITSFKSGNFKNIKKDMSISFKVVDPSGAIFTDNSVVLTPLSLRQPVNMGRLMTFLSLVKLKKRVHPLLLRNNQLTKINETINFPKKVTISGKKEYEIKNSQASLKYSYRAKGKKVVFKLKLIIFKREIPASGYNDFAKVIRAFILLSKTPVEFKYEGGNK